MSVSYDERAYLEGVGRDLAAEFPPSARKRGWRVANLEHGWERIAGETYNVDDGEDAEPVTLPETVREYWSCDIYGPVPDYRWNQYVGGAPFTVLDIHSGISGSIASATPEGLILMARQFVEQAIGSVPETHS